jgi:hypothetical protein
MKATQNFRISLSDLPLGSKSAPPFPPPMFTALHSSVLFTKRTQNDHVLLTSSQGILEDLLETQELQDTEIDSRMESQSSLVWTQSRVELHTVSTVDLDLVLVIFPDDTELDDAFGNGDDLEGGLVLWLLLEEGAVFEGGDKL